MKLKHLNLLCDPYSKSNLQIKITKQIGDEILEGILFSENSKYEITNGVPRFVKDEGYSKNFGWQWSNWSKLQFEEENIGKPMESHTKNMFLTITELNKNKVKDKIILDIGVGSGRFSDVASKLGAKLVCIDYSKSIDIAKNNLNNPEILYVQGDALNLPFKNEVFDFTFSIGVLHHTPNPELGVKEAYRVLKYGGEFALSVYSQGSLYTLSSVKFWRKIFNFLWKYFKHHPPLIYSRVFGTVTYYISKVNIKLTYPIRFFFPTVVLKDLHWTILDTFDSITTSYQKGYTIYEVFKWFEKYQYKHIRPGNWRVNLIGEK